MWSSILVFLQILKVFLDLWKEKDVSISKEKAKQAKEIVDAFAEANPEDKASKLNSVVNDIRMRK